MERQLIPESVQNRAKTVAKELNEQIKKVEKALDLEQIQQQLQQQVKRATDREWLAEQIRLEELKTRFNDGADEIMTKSTQWLDETYATVLDRLGIATKTEVDVLRRKLSSLQRRVRELKQTLKAN